MRKSTKFPPGLGSFGGSLMESTNILHESKKITRFHGTVWHSNLAMDNSPIVDDLISPIAMSDCQSYQAIPCQKMLHGQIEVIWLNSALQKKWIPPFIHKPRLRRGFTHRPEIPQPWTSKRAAKNGKTHPVHPAFWENPLLLAQRGRIIWQPIHLSVMIPLFLSLHNH